MNGAKLLDLVLALILVVSFITGARRGLFVALLGLAGYIGGAMLAMSLAPQLLAHNDSRLKRTLLTILIVLFLASIGNIVMTRIGLAIRKVVLFGPFRLVDSLLGGVISLLSVALLIWFLATLGNLAGPTNVSSLIKRSTVVNQVKQYMPQMVTTWTKNETGRLLGWFRSTVVTIPKL